MMSLVTLIDLKGYVGVVSGSDTILQKVVVTKPLFRKVHTHIWRNTNGTYLRQRESMGYSE